MENRRAAALRPRIPFPAGEAPPAAKGVEGIACPGELLAAVRAACEACEKDLERDLLTTYRVVLRCTAIEGEI